MQVVYYVVVLQSLVLYCFLGGVFRLAGQRRRGGGNIRTVKFVSIFLV